MHSFFVLKREYGSKASETTENGKKGEHKINRKIHSKNIWKNESWSKKYYYIRKNRNMLKEGKTKKRKKRKRDTNRNTKMIFRRLDSSNKCNRCLRSTRIFLTWHEQTENLLNDCLVCVYLWCAVCDSQQN